MFHKVSQYIEKLLLNEHSGKIIVGLSGGPDSIALLHILHRLGYECIAAHCNFHLRMEESDEDEVFVRSFCQSLKVKLYCIDFDTLKFASENKLSVEMAARELRYSWFEKLSDETGATAIATGHHTDDNVETMLLNLIRGTGIRGLTGIPPRNGNIIRPLLSCTRNEIIKYLINNNLSYRIDSTNAESDFTRNKIRNVILPMLEEVNPSIKHTFNKTIERFSEIRKFYEQCMEEKTKEIVHNSESETTIDIEKLLSNAAPGLLLYEILYPLGFHPAVIEQVADNLMSEPGKLFFSQNYRLLKDRKSLIITANDKININVYTISQDEKLISEPFILKIDHFQQTKDFVFEKNPKFLYIDAQKLSYPLKIRRWVKGDVFYPFGMKGKKKVSDYFIDEKLSIADKENVWLLLSGEEVIWVVGRRADNRYRVTKETTEIKQFELIDIDI